MLGDQLKYWQLFPAPDGYGNIPVWGFGEVIASQHPGIAVGERLFGYFPMATHLVLEAGDVSKRGLRDAAPHRRGVAPVYNAYARVGRDPAFTGRQGDHQALLRPLFMLSFLVDDHLAEHAFFGAECVLLSSASSKTAIGLAHLLHRRRDGIRVIGPRPPTPPSSDRSAATTRSSAMMRSTPSMPPPPSPSSTWPAARACAPRCTGISATT